MLGPGRLNLVLGHRVAGGDVTARHLIPATSPFLSIRHGRRPWAVAPSDAESANDAVDTASEPEGTTS
jgi:hypothetical protein